MELVNANTPWDGSQIPSQQGKVAIVTGANSGIGFEAAKKLAERHAIVVLACRSEERGRQAQRDILQHVENQRSSLSAAERAKLAPPQVDFMRLDVGSLASVEAFADEFRANFNHVDLLINNAGVALPSQKLTEDGIDSQFGINHIGHFYLTKLLFDLLEKSPSARVVNISSLAHRRAMMEFNEQGHLVVESGYRISKLANLMFTYELERRLRASRIDNVIAVAAHPGLASTDIIAKFIVNHVPRIFHWFAFKLTAVLPVQSAEMGALPTLYAATEESVQGMEYFGPHRWCRWGYPVRELSSVDSYNEEKAKKLWARSEELIKCKFELIPSQQGEVAVVTGENSGVGFASCQELAERGATVVLACLSEALGKQAQLPILEHVETLRSELSATESDALPPPRIELILLNFGSFASIRKSADEFRDSFDRFDLLINNAGLSFLGKGATEDSLGIEFGVNHIGHFYLTKLLIDSLKKSSSACVVTVSSLQHRNGTIDFDTQGHLVEESDYAVSKLANLLFTYELERHLRASRIDNVISVATHPGWASTSIIEKFLSDNVPRIFHWFVYGLVKLLSVQSPSNGALPTLYAATAEDVQGMEFFGPRHWGHGLPRARGLVARQLQRREGQEALVAQRGAHQVQVRALKASRFSRQ